MMRRDSLAMAVVLTAAALAACAPPGTPAFVEQQLALCRDSVLPQEQLSACSAVIVAGAAAPEQRAAALVERGVLRGELGQDARAVADFGRALRIDGALAQAYVERGVVHQNRGAFASALRDYEYALALDPGSSLALSGREASLRGLAQRPLTPLEQISQQIESDPYNALLWNQRCWLRAVSGEQLDLALADCEESLRLAPNSAHTYDSRGLVHLKLEQFPAALADYEAAVALEPGRAHYLYGRGIARLRVGDAARGRGDLALAERIEPTIRLQYAEYGVTP